ncbi:hypothetical protein QJS66_09770 [Kocuria rhizophila]|nr:hypothetical protein QJS66_09770 [Kocuria rhizophila]
MSLAAIATAVPAAAAPPDGSGVVGRAGRAGAAGGDRGSGHPGPGLGRAGPCAPRDGPVRGGVQGGRAPGRTAAPRSLRPRSTADVPRAETVRTTGSGEDVVETDTMLSCGAEGHGGRHRGQPCGGVRGA